MAGGVVRRALHGPITPACPASLLRLHADAEVTVADYVAELPDVHVSLSHEVVGTFREFERAASLTGNARERELLQRRATECAAERMSG